MFRDGQLVSDNCLGGIVTNLHQPWDWKVYDQLVGQNRVFVAIGCHPKQAALFNTSLMKKMEELLQKPGVVAVGECGLDYSSR